MRYKKLNAAKKEEEKEKGRNGPNDFISAHIWTISLNKQDVERQQTICSDKTFFPFFFFFFTENFFSGKSRF